MSQNENPNVRIPHEPFNSLVREGKAGKIIQNIIGELKPEIIYFTEQGGTRYFEASPQAAGTLPRSR